MDSYRKTIIIENGRITAGFPFTNEVKNLKDNFNVAVRRLQNLLRILQADQEKFTLYDETLTSYLQEGIIEEAKNEADSLATFYLPHRHVWTPTKSTKLRVVFDASSHAKDELSLNDVIYEGHSLTPLIHEVLLKFRTHLFTMVADIQKAFLQIRLPSSHRDVTRFLWVKDILRPATGNNLKTLRFCRVPFGINASPAILNQCILKHIEGSNSEISQELSSSLYVDNVFLEGNNADDLLAKYYESKKLFSSIGMNLRDYLSNSANVNRSIPESDRATSIDMKVLGIQWNALGDSISLKCVEKQSVKVSKRTILSQINGYCFDPLGLLTPLLLPAKIFLQDLHKKKSGWDAPLSEEDETTWRAIHAKINGFEITLPRKVMEKKSSTQHTLSVFVDSSKRAYACSIYVTTISCSNRNSRLFTAKSKIAPINKEQTIPRLELLSIFIGLSLAESTIERINTNFDQINVFSDSTIALCWIQGNRRLPTIVSNLVQKINTIANRLRESTALTFFHVPTNENVADCATRGVTKDDLKKHRWWNGPLWLNQTNDSWPAMKADELCQQSSSSAFETALYASNTEENVIVPIWPTEKFSNYSKLVRIVAYCARFIRNATKNRCLPLSRNGLQTMSPSAEEATIAEKLIIRQEQTVFKSELLLHNTQLNVKIDKDGIYRRYGRLQNADLRFSTVNPIHIPKQSKLGPLIALNLHKLLAHCGSNQLLYNIRRRFWIPLDRTLCKRTLKNCSTCRKINALPYSYPNMGPLPSERVTQSPPFSCTGVDFMGPITTKSASGEDCKRYVALFTCLVTRLVHLEVAVDLSARSFIFALKRFIARRGVPRKIISDNGTNFHLTESLLRSNKSVEDTTLSSFLADYRIIWNFIPPSSPWMGGVWERMVGTVKRSFQKTVGRRKLTDELLYTTLCEIESVVNSRPLTSIGSRNSPIETLRPIDFVYKNVRHGTTQLTINEDNEDPDYQPYPELSSQKAAKQAISETEKITKKFWTIWKNEYLMELRNRHKMAGKISRTSNHPPTIGEVVLLDDDSQLPRGQWPMAVILDLVTSRDTEVRSAMLQTASGKIVQRPINRLIPMEIKSSIESPNRSEADLLTTRETEARTATKPYARRGNPPEVAVRLQPPRAAKNTTAYREEQPTAKKGSQSLSTSTLITMVACIFALSNVNAASASSISCSTRGVKVNDKVSTEAELCINYKHCTIYPPGAIKKEVTLPFHYLVNRHTVQWRTITNKKQHVDTIECPAHEVCASIDCIVCVELLLNPHCAPQFAIAVAALVLFLITFPFVAACYVTAHWRMRSNSATSEQARWKRASEIKEGNHNLAMVNATTSMANSKMVLFSVISTCLIASADACQYTHSISVNNTACEQSNSLIECRNILESTTTLSERRPQACFRIRNSNRTIGTMEVKLQRVILTCNPVVLFYTRDVDLITESAKRCDLAGSCNSQTCAHVSRTSVVPELRDTYDFPGVTRCSTSCGGIPCGCLLPMPGCLFSRTYAKPRSRTIYQVFHCPTWTESVEMEYSFTRSGGEKTSENVNVITQGTQVVRNANITLQFVTMPTIPLLSSTFVQAIDVNGTEVAIVGKDDFFSLRCPTWESSKNVTECYVEDKCTCSLSNSAANCVCQNLDLHKRMASIQNRLPLSSSVLQLHDAHGRVYGTIHDAVADITITTSLAFKADSMINNEDCAIKASPVKGCYNCLSGAEVTFSCYAQQPVVAEIECDQKLFAASCNSSTTRTTVLIHPTTARYNESCLVRCGRETHHVILSGVLAYYPGWKISGANNASKHANYVDVFNYPDLGHTLDVVFNNWKTTLVTFVAVMALTVAAVCLLRSIVFRLLC